MKVYIATYHREINFGAALQAYATQQILKGLGYENELIAFKNVLEVESKPKDIKGMINKIYNKIHSKEIAKGLERFNDFFKNYHKITKEYENFKDLENNPPYDKNGTTYLSGSDQVFNVTTMLPEFFLQFGSENVRKISYAASVGINKIPQEKEKKLEEYLKAFDFISIREEASKKLLQQYTDKDIEVNIDPTYLLDKKEWEKLQNIDYIQCMKKPYILVYALYNPKWLGKTLKKIHKQTGYEIVLISNKGYRPMYKNVCIMDAGPLEFLSLVANAKGVISSSFHGCVFSTIYRKPFYAVINPSSPDRINSLLEKFGLLDRILDQNKEKFDFAIDYNFFEKQLKKEKERTYEYLKKAIGE